MLETESEVMKENRFTLIVRVTWLSAFWGLMLTACSTPPASPEITSSEIQSIQTREIDTTYDVAFKSVLSVLQDLGYIIEEAEIDAGLITAEVSRQEGSFVRKTIVTRVTSSIEEMPSGLTRIRLNFFENQTHVYVDGSKNNYSERLLDPETYQDAFERIEKEVSVRSPAT